MRRAPLRDKGLYVAGEEGQRLRRAVIGGVGEERLRTPPGCACLPGHRWNLVHRGDHLSYIMRIRASECAREGKALPAREQVMLAAGLAVACRIGANCGPAKTA